MEGRLCYWISRFRGFSVTQITPDMVEQELLILSEPISGSSVNRYKSNLSSVFNQLNKPPQFTAVTVQDDDADGASATEAAAGDGMIDREELANIIIEGLEQESFLILAHP